MLQNYQNTIISERTKVLIDKLLLGKFSLPEVAKIVGVSEQWLHTYVHANLHSGEPEARARGQVSASRAISARTAGCKP